MTTSWSDESPGHLMEPGGSPRCTSTAKSTGLRCGNPSRKGGRVCRIHGGNAPHVRVAAERRIAEQAAGDAVGRLASVATPAVPVDNPLTALALLAGEALRFKDLLAGYVAELQDLRYRGAVGEQVRGEITLYSKLLDQCSNILVATARLRIDERLVVISERQADIVVSALEAGLAAAGVDGVAAAIARVETGRQLRLIGGVA